MSPFVVSSIAFACLLGSAGLGIALQRILPEHHFSADSKALVNLGMGLIGTMAALALGLILASAKDSYDTTRSEVTQMAANIGLLDRALAHYGPETHDARDLLRRSLDEVIVELWSKDESNSGELEPTSTGFASVFDKVQALTPQNELQRTTQTHSVDIMVDIGRTLWLLYEQRDRSIAVALIVMLIFWFVVIFAGFGLFAPRNATVFFMLFLCAISVSAALFLILELDRPFGGLIQIPSAPLRATAAQIGR